MSLKKLFICLISLCVLSLWSMTVIAETAEAYDIYGKPYHFSLPPGKWVVINYWATWCPYCIHEIPMLNRLAKAITAANAVFFGVNYDNAPDDEQQAFANSYNIRYPLLHNNPFQTLLGGQEISALPTTFIISPTGQVSVLYGELHPDEVMAVIR